MTVSDLVRSKPPTDGQRPAGPASRPCQGGEGEDKSIHCRVRGADYGIGHEGDSTGGEVVAEVNGEVLETALPTAVRCGRGSARRSADHGGGSDEEATDGCGSVV